MIGTTSPKSSVATRTRSATTRTRSATTGTPSATGLLDLDGLSAQMGTMQVRTSVGSPKVSPRVSPRVSPKVSPSTSPKGTTTPPTKVAFGRSYTPPQASSSKVSLPSSPASRTTPKRNGTTDQSVAVPAGFEALFGAMSERLAALENRSNAEAQAPADAAAEAAAEAAEAKAAAAEAKAAIAEANAAIAQANAATAAMVAIKAELELAQKAHAEESLDFTRRCKDLADALTLKAAAFEGRVTDAEARIAATSDEVARVEGIVAAIDARILGEEEEEQAEDEEDVEAEDDEGEVAEEEEEEVVVEEAVVEEDEDNADKAHEDDDVVVADAALSDLDAMQVDEFTDRTTANTIEQILKDLQDLKEANHVKTQEILGLKSDVQTLSTHVRVPMETDETETTAENTRQTIDVEMKLEDEETDAVANATPLIQQLANRMDAIEADISERLLRGGATIESRFAHLDSAIGGCKEEAAIAKEDRAVLLERVDGHACDVRRLEEDMENVLTTMKRNDHDLDRSIELRFARLDTQYVHFKATTTAKLRAAMTAQEERLGALMESRFGDVETTATNAQSNVERLRAEMLRTFDTADAKIARNQINLAEQREDFQGIAITIADLTSLVIDGFKGMSQPTAQEIEEDPDRPIRA
ncbi:uncharacterized protein EV422DRAFT_617763 [Fimicolochytrium jonesii]|uniref:uncharacterized protein n=1 Tax=Fimicolochytrium jonesii TaxID=1396493 RepID=UPI0022FEDF4D|nr:uncharacterized protein EV422DRAFT_617763 [Fimicolochytrium jonesii]KAI8824023.1 hypothetical protein EV422DRAFT_617763 [Fimicolochytrium jonesii]